MNAKTRVAAIEGWYTLEDPPHLIGSRCCSCGSYFFPRLGSYCRNPNACYQPPPPFVAAEPFVPFAIAAVELAAERMIVLGQVVAGVTVAQLKVGMPVELVLESLYAEGDAERLVWKWKPLEPRP